MRGVTLLAALAALAAGALLACGGDATAGTAVSAPRPPDGAGLENASPTATGTVDAPASLDCPPTRAISDAVRGPVDVPSGDFIERVSDAPVHVMDVWCTGCHAPGAAEPAPSGPSDASDFNRMIEEGFVIDCDAERSPIIISMRASEMPPLDYFGISAPPSDIDVVASFIELECSDVENACADSPSGPGCDEVLAERRTWRCTR